MDQWHVKNWELYQHYKDRNPPWIKLHISLMTSEDWVTLDDASRVLMIACMLIASKNGGDVPNNPAYLRRVAYLNTTPDFQPLVDCGFLVKKDEDASKQADDASVLLASASTMLADASVLLADSPTLLAPSLLTNNDARPETETEEIQRREEKSKTPLPPVRPAANTTPFPASPPPVTLPTPVPQPSLPGLPDTPSRNPKPDELFAQFWEAYPKKVDKGHARKAFCTIKDMPLLLPKILAAIEAQKQSKQWLDRGGKFVPNPATWLNGTRWEDQEPQQQRPAGYAENPCGWEEDES